jgi:hypothetical protein
LRRNTRARRKRPNGPLVSIVIPTYNMPQFLGSALRSVAAQDYGRIQVIVVDGGNDELTPAIVDEHREVVAEYIREPDRGQSDAINKGFARSKGEILAWLNADDYYFPNAVSWAVRTLGSMNDVDVVYGDAVYVDRDGQFLRYFTEVEPFDAERLCTYSDFVCQPTTFFRRQAIEAVGFLSRQLHFTMDWDLWCRLAEAGAQFHYGHELVAANREYPETKTVAGGLPRLTEIFRTNLNHSRRRIPWGALAFAGDQALRRVESLPGFGDAAAPWLSWLRRVKRVATRGKSVAPLYGIHHRSRGCLRHALVSVPLPDGALTAIEVGLRLPPGLDAQQVTVSLNQHELGVIEVQQAEGVAERRFILRREDGRNRLDLDLRAARSHAFGGREFCFELATVRFKLLEPSLSSG